MATMVYGKDPNDTWIETFVYPWDNVMRHFFKVHGKDEFYTYNCDTGIFGLARDFSFWQSQMSKNISYCPQVIAAMKNSITPSTTPGTIPAIPAPLVATLTPTFQPPTPDIKKRYDTDVFIGTVDYNQTSTIIHYHFLKTISDTFYYYRTDADVFGPERKIDEWKKITVFEDFYKEAIALMEASMPKTIKKDTKNCVCGAKSIGFEKSNAGHASSYCFFKMGE